VPAAAAAAHGMRNQVSRIPEKIRGSCPGG
jgi:hypothetical protein